MRCVCACICVCVWGSKRALCHLCCVLKFPIWLFHGKLALMNDISVGGRRGHLCFIMQPIRYKWKWKGNVYFCLASLSVFCFLCNGSWHVSLYTSGCERRCVRDPLQGTCFSHPTVLVLPWGVWERSVTTLVSELIAGNDQWWVVPSTSKSLHPDCGLPLGKWIICAQVCMRHIHLYIHAHMRTFFSFFLNVIHRGWCYAVSFTLICHRKCPLITSVPCPRHLFICFLELDFARHQFRRVAITHPNYCCSCVSAEFLVGHGSSCILPGTECVHAHEN